MVVWVSDHIEGELRGGGVGHAPHHRDQRRVHLVRSSAFSVSGFRVLGFGVLGFEVWD